MRFFQKSHDGGKDSGVTGYFLIEIKSLFSVVLLKFNKGTREAYHNHAFNAFTVWLKGSVKEHKLSGETLEWSAGDIKFTPRTNFHKVEALTDTWAISFRGPWLNSWNEHKHGKKITLTHGRKIINE